MTTGLVEVSELADRAWALLARGADDPVCALHLLTLATTSPDQRPSARVMVNRGADPVTGRLWFHTDLHSPKVADIRAIPFACVVGYDPETGVELRAAGSASVHTHGPLADRHWEQMSRVAGWLISSPNDRPDGRYATDLRLPPDPSKLTSTLTARARGGFAVIEIIAETIDWLQAIGTQRRRAVLRRDNHWRAELLPE